jgi:hypothetical protein
MNSDGLKIIINRLGISKSDLATIVGVTERQVYSWLNRTNRIPRSVSIVLAALDNEKISLDWVVSFVEMEIRREISNDE